MPRGGNNIKYSLVNIEKDANKRKNNSVWFYSNLQQDLSKVEMIVIIGECTTESSPNLGNMIKDPIGDLMRQKFNIAVKVPNIEDDYKGHQNHEYLLYSGSGYYDIYPSLKKLYDSGSNIKNYQPQEGIPYPPVFYHTYIKSCQSGQCKFSGQKNSANREGSISKKIILGKIHSHGETKSPHHLQEILVDTYEFIINSPELNNRYGLDINKPRLPVLLLL